MSFEQRTCIVIVCDTTSCNPREDRVLHFDSKDDAVAWAKASGWMVAA